MNKNNTNRRNWYNWLYRGIRWIIPVIILYFVFQKIDLATFKVSIAKTNPWLVALGLAHFPLLIFIGVWRWRLLLTQYHQQRVQLNFVFRHYWIGLAIGFFMPASLGWDAYRIVVSGRRFGRYTLNTAAILVEKLMALVTCTTLVVVLYPFVSIALTPVIVNVFNLIYALFFISVLLVGGITLALRNRILFTLLEKFEFYCGVVLGKLGGKLTQGNAKDIKFPLREMIEPLAAPKNWLGVLVLSFGIQFVGAVKSQIFFQALGYDLPFIVNLFLIPTFHFIFLLPISFGSLGIREGVFILLYGLFGVPPEIALLVSFFNLFGLLLNNAIGGGVMLISNIKGEGLSKPIVQSQAERLPETTLQG